MHGICSGSEKKLEMQGFRTVFERNWFVFQEQASRKARQHLISSPAICIFAVHEVKKIWKFLCKTGDPHPAVLFRQKHQNSALTDLQCSTPERWVWEGTCTLLWS